MTRKVVTSHQLTSLMIVRDGDTFSISSPFLWHHLLNQIRQVFYLLNVQESILELTTRDLLCIGVKASATYTCTPLGKPYTRAGFLALLESLVCLMLCTTSMRPQLIAETIMQTSLESCLQAWALADTTSIAIGIYISFTTPTVILIRRVLGFKCFILCDNPMPSRRNGRGLERYWTRS
jgi:hypothetical protein